MLLPLKQYYIHYRHLHFTLYILCPQLAEDTFHLKQFLWKLKLIYFPNKELNFETLRKWKISKLENSFRLTTAAGIIDSLTTNLLFHDFCCWTSETQHSHHQHHPRLYHTSQMYPSPVCLCVEQWCPGVKSVSTWYCLSAGVSHHLQHSLLPSTSSSVLTVFIHLN